MHHRLSTNDPAVEKLGRSDSRAIPSGRRSVPPSPAPPAPPLVREAEAPLALRPSAAAVVADRPGPRPEAAAEEGCCCCGAKAAAQGARGPDAAAGELSRRGMWRGPSLNVAGLSRPDLRSAAAAAPPMCVARASGAAAAATLGPAAVAGRPTDCCCCCCGCGGDQSGSSSCCTCCCCGGNWGGRAVASDPGSLAVASAPGRVRSVASPVPCAPGQSAPEAEAAPAVAPALLTDPPPLYAGGSGSKRRGGAARDDSGTPAYESRGRWRLRCGTALSPSSGELVAAGRGITSATSVRGAVLEDASVPGPLLKDASGQSSARAMPPLDADGGGDIGPAADSASGGTTDPVSHGPAAAESRAERCADAASPRAVSSTEAPSVAIPARAAATSSSAATSASAAKTASSAADTGCSGPSTAATAFSSNSVTALSVVVAAAADAAAADAAAAEAAGVAASAAPVFAGPLTSPTTTASGTDFCQRKDTGCVTQAHACDWIVTPLTLSGGLRDFHRR